MKKATKYDFIDFKHSSQVMTDFPSLIFLLKKLIPALEEKEHYTAVSDLLKQTRESKLLLETQYAYYRDIYDRKAKVQE